MPKKFSSLPGAAAGLKPDERRRAVAGPDTGTGHVQLGRAEARFFEFDRAAHCGADASGRFSQTLTGTNVGSGWVEIRACRNRAHRWGKERVQQIRDELPFPLPGPVEEQPPAQRLV